LGINGRETAVAVAVSKEPVSKGEAGTLAPTRGENTLFENLAKIVAPTTLVTALVFYFGVKREQSLVLYFGIDPSVLGLSMQDYLYRSVDVLVPLLLLAALIGLIGLQLHLLVSRQLDRRQGRKMLGLVARLMAVVGTGGVALGAMALFRSLPFVPDFLFPPLSLALGASLLAYGVHLNRRIGTIEGRSASKTREERWLATGTTTFLGLLVAVGLFWAAADFADALGRGRAQQLAGRLHQLSSVIVYSDKQLHFGEAHGVQEEALERVNDNVRFRYGNLRLLLRSGDKYFLSPMAGPRETGK
jgi:hypothetical protein